MKNIFLVVCLVQASNLYAQFDNRLAPLKNGPAILADHPKYVLPVKNKRRFISETLVKDKNANLSIRAWRFSYNARGIVDVPNRLRGDRTAIVVVHPWGIDDGQGWNSPEPAGVSFFCTPAKNRLYQRHVKEVLNPWLKKLRHRVRVVAYSLPGKGDPIRTKLYRSVKSNPTQSQRQLAAKLLKKRLTSFSYEGKPIRPTIDISRQSAKPIVEQYFAQFSGLDSSDRMNGAGFWALPIPVVRQIEVADSDVVAYDDEGYSVFRDFLKKQGVRHVLLAGYATDMCVCRTMAGYENLQKDFNVFLVGDATMATFPASDSPAAATQASLCFASLKLFITQVSWIKKK